MMRHDPWSQGWRNAGIRFLERGQITVGYREQVRAACLPVILPSNVLKGVGRVDANPLGLEDKSSASEVFCSCSFIPRARAF